MVKLDTDDTGNPHLTIIHLNSICQAIHLLPAHQNNTFIEHTIRMHTSLDAFKLFYINKFMDHQSFEVLLGDKYLSFNTACPTLVLSLVLLSAAPSLAVYLLTTHITYTSQPPFILVRTHSYHGPYPQVYLGPSRTSDVCSILTPSYVLAIFR